MNILKIKSESIEKLQKILKNADEHELDKSTISIIEEEIILIRKKNRKLLDNLENSPYYNIASQYWHRKGVLEPSCLHALVAFHEFGKIDHRINKNIKN